MTTTSPDIVRAAYAHVPFCQTICGYCDFYSVLIDKSAVHPLVDALVREFDDAVAAHPTSLRTIFVGGGTPTTLPPDALARLLRRLAAERDPAAPLEFTVEANPATVTPEIAAALVECGVTRVSIGAQSFHRGELNVLERIHRPEQVPQTIDICRAAGIRQVNLDLIFGVPGQTLASWLRNLAAAIALGPDHISCYALTYEKGTPLFEQRAARLVTPVAEEAEAEMYESTIDTLAAAEYRQYEISNFARSGRECRHNLVYWRNEPSHGIGPSAAGLVGGVRHKNIPDHREYVRAIAEGRSPRLSEERLSPDRRARETAMLGLRLNEGIDRNRFRERFGNDPVDFFAETIERHRQIGLIDVDEQRIALTPRGRLLADGVAAEFL